MTVIQSQSSFRSLPFWKKTFIAGFIVITINSVLLKLAKPLGFNAESGGLLKLMVLKTGSIAKATGISRWWTEAGLPLPSSLIFWLVFHYLTGFAMVLLYVVFLEKRLPGNWFVKGTLFSLFPWLINGLIVLPLLGQGIFGYQTLPFSGMVYFFIANWVFTVTFVYINNKSGS